MMTTLQKFLHSLALVILGVLLLAATALALESSPAIISVVTGESRVISTHEVSRVALADETIADIVVVSPSEIIVNGKAPGVTTLHLWEKAGRKEYLVKVYVDNSTLAAEIAKAINDPNITVRVLRQTVFLEGQIEGEFESIRAQKIALAYEEKVVNLLRIPLKPEEKNETPMVPTPEPKSEVISEESSPDLSQVARELTAYLGADTFQAKVYGKGILVEGTVASETDKERIEAIADFFADQTGCDITVVLNIKAPRGPKVALQVKVVEISNEVMDSIGLTWGSLYNGGVVPYKWTFSQMDLDTSIERISPIAAELELMVQDGDARILAAPSLVTNSNEQAEFLAGGEVPIPFSVGDTMTLEWKEYGVQLSMLPQVHDGNMIDLAVNPEVSSLDMTNAATTSDGASIPAIKTRRTETKVDLQSGETLIIGGLISNEQSKIIQKVPILGDIPILGQLFRSTEFVDGQTQLIIMVTPHIILEGNSLSLEELLNSELRGEMAEEFPELSFFPPPPQPSDSSPGEKGSETGDSPEN